MSRATIAVIIPTQGRPTLARTLASIEAQTLMGGDEVIVVADTRAPLLSDVAGLVAHVGVSSLATYRYLAHDGGRMSWGHDQINVGLSQARAAWLAIQDDDDVYTPGAFTAIREATVDHTGPVLFRFRTHYGLVVWDARGVIAEGHIGGHCLLQPNIRDRVGAMTPRYEGDYDWIVDTVAKWGGPASVKWDPTLIAVGRP